MSDRRIGMKIFIFTARHAILFLDINTLHARVGSRAVCRTFTIIYVFYISSLSPIYKIREHEEVLPRSCDDLLSLSMIGFGAPYFLGVLGSRQHGVIPCS